MPTETYRENISKVKTVIFTKPEVLAALGIEVPEGWAAAVGIYDSNYGPPPGAQEWQLVVTVLNDEHKQPAVPNWDGPPRAEVTDTRRRS